MIPHNTLKNPVAAPISLSTLSANICGKKVCREVLSYGRQGTLLPYQFTESGPTNVVDRILSVTIPGKIEYQGLSYQVVSFHK